MKKDYLEDPFLHRQPTYSDNYLSRFSYEGVNELWMFIK